MKKLITCIFCLTMAFSVVSCQGDGSINIDSTSDGGQSSTDDLISDDGHEIADPFVECGTLEEAENLVGFTINIPGGFDNLQDPIIRVDTDYNMIELIYNCDDDNQIRIRKAISDDDISGDYTVYDSQGSITIGDLEVNISGNDGSINLITWKNGEYSHSVSIDDNLISQDDVIDFIDNIKL